MPDATQAGHLELPRRPLYRVQGRLDKLLSSARSFTGMDRASHLSSFSGPTYLLDERGPRCGGVSPSIHSAVSSYIASYPLRRGHRQVALGPACLRCSDQPLSRSGRRRPRSGAPSLQPRPSTIAQLAATAVARRCAMKPSYAEHSRHLGLRPAGNAGGISWNNASSTSPPRRHTTKRHSRPSPSGHLIGCALDQ